MSFLRAPKFPVIKKNGKLQEGVSFNHILDSIRDNESNQIDTNQRRALIERKDLHNIVRDYQIDYSTKRHQNAAVSFKLWVAEMEALKEECPILYYKGQGEEDLESSLQKDDFALIIMTKFQAQQLDRFGANKICIGGTNAYDIQLYTIMTVDEFGSGCPVAYCFSNRGDEYIFSLYFSKLKEKIGIIRAKVFMSDDAPAFYNAWASVIGDAENRLLCTYIDKNWRLNLNKIKGGTNKKALVYKSLLLLQTTSVDEIQTSLHSVLHQLSEDNDTKDSGEYFKNHYAYRSESWPYCYRLGLGINTYMYLQSFHQILKHIYLEGKKVKRLDKTIDGVMRIARDSLFKRLIKLTKHTRTEKTGKIFSSHKSSTTISVDMISTLEDKEWLVSSCSDISKKYHVCFIQRACLQQCLECKICIHSFKCSCTDSLIKLNICKHIHACAQLYLGCSSRSITPTLEHEGAGASEVDNLLDMCQGTTAQEVHLNKKIIKKAELIIGLSSNSKISEEDSTKISRYLDNVISLLNKGDTVSLETTQNINVQQFVEKQPRLYSTKKKKIISSSFQKPSFTETIAIKEGLHNESGEVLNINNSEFDHAYLLVDL